MNNITLLIVVSTIMYATFQILSKYVAGKIDSSLYPFFTSFFTIVIPLLAYFYTKQTKGGAVTFTSEGLVIASFAGIALAIYAISIARAFQLGANAGYLIPMIFGGAILLSSMYSVIILKENSNFVVISGMAFVTIGLVLVAIGNK